LLNFLLGERLKREDEIILKKKLLAFILVLCMSAMSVFTVMAADAVVEDTAIEEEGETQEEAAEEAAAPEKEVTEEVTEETKKDFYIEKSAQKFAVNDTEIALEVYNIDGYNYFKLRDIANVLANTAAKFSVSFNEETGTIALVKGEAYVAAGGEGEVRDDVDLSTTVAGNDSITVDGEAKELSAYNIAGNNFFMLRDLGSALGFEVQYDAETNTAKIITVFDEVEETEETKKPEESEGTTKIIL